MMSNQNALKRCERMYQTHRSEVVVGAKTTGELLRCAEDFVDLEAVDPAAHLPPSSLRRIRQMMADLFAEDEALRGKTPEILLFLVKPGGRNQVFYQESDGTPRKGEVFLWLEVHSAYFQTSSALLFSKLRRVAGISQEDLDARGEEFLLYMTQSFLHDPDNPMMFPEDPPGADIRSTVFVPVEQGLEPAAPPETPE